MIDPKKDFDENDWAHDRHRRIVELMRMQGANDRRETYAQFGLIVAAVLFAFALIMAVM
jgi:hypothetical protein